MAKQTVLLYLHSFKPLLASWVIVDENNLILHTVLRSDLSNLKSNDRQEVVVVTPATDILLTHALLPKLKSQRLQQAIPFAIEEQLIDDITALHFAIGNYQPENNWPVAVLNLTTMTEWLDALKQYHIQPSLFIPAPLALPLIENHWAIYCIDGFCFVRINDYSGFTCEQENLSAYLESKLGEEIQLPSEIDYYSDNEFLPSLNTPIPINNHVISENQFIESLWLGVKNYPFINLMQGPFQAKRKSMETKKLWIYAGLATIIWLTIGFLSNVFSFILLHHQAAKIESSIETIYQKNFPDATTMISPQERMEQKLKKLTTEASNESFLILLAHVGQAFSESHGIRLQNLEYRDKLLTLEISAATFDTLDNLTQLLKKQNLSVKQQNAEVVAARVKATLQINTGNP